MPVSDRLPAGPAAVLDRKLCRNITAPLAVALSGGGDSLALLLMAKAWADGAGRRLIAYTVDHRLQPASADWALWCAERASRLGLEHRILAWEGEKPSTGLPAAARRARHRLIAEAARADGAAVILMGHTADDVLEAGAMRAAGSTTPSPRAWAPSPVWPHGRGLFILRPLLDERRAALRAWLAARGEPWIEDPANDDPRFARARARRAPGSAAPHCRPRSPMAGADQLSAGLADLVIPRGTFQEAGARSLLAALVVCASGVEAAPRGDRLERLRLALAGDDAPFTATLAGARIEAEERHVRILREPGEFRRGAATETPLIAGQPIVWDGRFEITSMCEGRVVRPLAGLASRLPKTQADTLRGVHPIARRSLPAVVDAEGKVTCPVLAGRADVMVRSLVLERFRAAAGLVEDEASIWRVAKVGATS